jgi:hypothetical protein
VGRLPRGHLPRRRRGRDRQPQRAPDDPLLPGAGGRDQGRAAGAVRHRRGDRDPRRRRAAAGLRGPAAAHPPGREPDQPAGRADPGPSGVFRRAGRGRSEPDRGAVLGPAGGAGERAGRGGQVGAPDAGHPGPGHGPELVRPVRGGGPGRRGGQEAGRPVRRGQANHVQDQARADRGLRGGRLPAAQDRRRRDRLAAAWPLQADGRARERRGDRRVSDGGATRAAG